MISRRRFLALGPVLAATAGAGPTSLVKDVLAQGVGDPAQNPTRSQFAALVHTKFRVQLEPLRSIEIELLEVNDPSTGGGKVAAPADPEHQFSLLFKGPDAEPFGQRTYELQHARMGSFPMFLVPVGQAAHGRFYEAVFNRIGAPPAKEA